MDRRTLVALVVVQVLFGLFPVAGKFAFQDFGPFSIGAYRTVVAGALLLVAQRFLSRRRVDLGLDAGPVALLALFGIVLNQGFFMVGLQWTTATNATLIITTIPVFTYAIAVLSGRETLGPRRAAGIGLALLGVLWLVGVSGYEAGTRTAVGDLFILFNCLSYAIFLVFSKPYAQKYSPLSLTAWTFFFGAFAFLPLALIGGVEAQSQSAGLVGWSALAFIIAGPTVGAYVLNNTALRTVPSSTVGAFIYLQPLFATSSAAWLLGEKLTWRLVPAAAAVFTGVWLVVRRRPQVLEGRGTVAEA